MSSVALHQMRYEWKIFYRNKSGVFFTLMLPLMALVLAMVAAPNNDSYGDTLIPGIIALIIASTCYQSLSIGLAFHRDQGVLKQLRVSPLPMAAFVAARLAVYCVITLLEVSLVMAVGNLMYGIGWPLDWLLFIATFIAGTFCMSTLGFAVAGAVPNGESAPAVTNAIFIPVMFISGIFFPLDSMPGIAQNIAEIFPLSHLGELLRTSYETHAGIVREISPGELEIHAAVIAAWAALGLLLTKRWFHWLPSDER